MPEIDSALEFQQVIGRFIEKMGFQIDSAKVQDDNSVDFSAQTTNPMGGRVLSIIRASSYSRLVSEGDIIDLNKVMNQSGAVRAAYITTSGFSEEAVEAAKDKPISLINKYQLMDSLEKRGLLTDKDLMESLDKFGMGEQHFQGFEQSFEFGKTDEQAKNYFLGKAKKSEKLASVGIRYAPVVVLKTTSLKDFITDDQTLRTVEKKDYMFVNLNNLDLYYLMQKRSNNTTESMLMKSDILKKINGLTPESKQHLLDLLDHGDLPIEDLQGKELSILKNKKIIEIYEGKRMKVGDFTEYAQMFLEGVLETINMIVNEIVSGVSSMGEDTGKKKDDEKPKKKVAAEVQMPHVFDGIYDIWKYLESVRGTRHDADIDALNFTSSDVAKLLKSLMKAKVRSEGIIFMPYFRAKYLDSKEKVSKYEVLVVPRFKSDSAKTRKDEAVESAPRIRAGKKSIAGEFRLIK